MIDVAGLLNLEGVSRAAAPDTPSEQEVKS
jgi:hypothetical protein